MVKQKSYAISITISSYFLKYRIPEITTAEDLFEGAANDFLATVCLVIIFFL